MFTLDPRLHNDTYWVGDLSLCRLLLMNDQQYPWCILVPRVADISEMHHLSPEQQRQFSLESNALSETLQTLYQPETLNVAALGNVVRQLHIHHIARFVDDPAWPAPIWGQHPVVNYNDEAAQRLLVRLQNTSPIKDLL